MEWSDPANVWRLLRGNGLLPTTFRERTCLITHQEMGGPRRRHRQPERTHPLPSGGKRHKIHRACSGVAEISVPPFLWDAAWANVLFLVGTP